MRQLRVNVGNGYDILIEKGLLSSCGECIRAVSNAGKVCLISDTNVYNLYGELVEKQLTEHGFHVFSYVFKAGEASKTTSTVISMVEFMAEHRLTRGDLVVALGGGVTGDMAGFSAAMYLRGIDFVQIPTSLLAQVDSSVGGKTAVDLPQGKNLCGAFHQPILVLIDTETLDTLTPHFFSDGMAEAIKTGCIKDAALLEKIESDDAVSNIDDIIFDCVRIKAGVVERDEKEHGERALLNFGHTVGHAIEKLHHFKTISHGEAVGIGMVMVAGAGENAGYTQKGTAERIRKVLEKYHLPVSDNHDIKDIVPAMSSDKKSTGTSIKFTLLHSIGDAYSHNILNEDIPSFFGI